MSQEFKAVPAVYKCFSLIELLSTSPGAMGITAMAAALGYHRSTVYNIAHSLADLDILSRGEDGKFSLGTGFFRLARTQMRHKGLIQTVRPHLEAINRETRLSVFLGVRSGMNAVIIDKADDITGLKISSDIGDSHPIFAGAGGKALLSRLSETELDALLARTPLEAYTPSSCTDKKKFKSMIRDVQKNKIACDMEEYTEGVRAIAVPFSFKRSVPAAIWAVGLKKQLPCDRLKTFGALIKKTAQKIETQLLV